MAKKITHEDFEKSFYDIWGNEYSLLSTYTSYKEKVLIRHNECGTERWAEPKNLRTKKRCSTCLNKSKRKTHEKFVKEVNELGFGEYEVLGEYIKDNEEILIKHIKCGHKYIVKPDRFIQGKRCPKCRKSKGECLISNILQSKDIKFEEQYRFPDCKNKSPLPFDFAILDDDGSVVMLIEFQGIQHYQPIEFLGGKDRFNYTENNDLIKSNYCKEKGISLLTISYRDLDKLEDIINISLKGR